MKARILIAFLILVVFALGALGGVWAQAFLMPYLASHAWFQQWEFVQDWSERTTVVREVREVVIRLDDAAQRVASGAEGMVVGVESRSAGHVITGSGFAATSDGFIFTLASVVPQGYETRVYLKNAEEFARAEILKRDLRQNLAIIKIDAKNLQTAGFSNDDSLQLGEPVVLVAKSLEAGQLISIVNQGSMRAKDETSLRTNIFDKSTVGGSPLFDLEGRIVGLSAFEPDGRLVAIPSSAMRAFSGF